MGRSVAGSKGPIMRVSLFCDLEVCTRISEMASTSLRFKDRLDGASNLLAWKFRVIFLLEENDLWVIVKVVGGSSTNPLHLVAHQK